MQFGDTEENIERFARFYETYALNVTVGANSASITNEAPQKSAYVCDGSTVQLTFSGYLKTLGREVSMPIVLPEGVSYTLHAAQHLIITLGLEPDAESAVVNVQKAVLDSVGIEEKISYNLLPRPVVTTEHKYVRGELVGTDLSIGASFPDVEWEATVADNAQAKKGCIEKGMAAAVIDHESLLKATSSVYDKYRGRYGQLLEMLK